MSLAIEVRNISKAYHLYDKPSLRLKETLHPFRKKYHREFFALKNVSFTLDKGETLGILGANGSGKSTLLKIITGVLNPTEGEVIVNGRISSLLELGTGFNPELSGLNNLHFYGVLHGFEQEQMNQKIDEILSFADIGDFIYQPVKTYSSGMYSRLAFSAAVHIEPEILIVDEVLAVGDMFFQQKCIHKMKKMFESGITILYVSHSHESVRSLCKKGLLLQKGEVELFSDSKSVFDVYFKKSVVLESKTPELTDSNTDLATIEEAITFKEGEFKIGNEAWEKNIERLTEDHRWLRNLVVLDDNNQLTTSIEFGQDIEVKMFLSGAEDLNEGSVVLRLWNEVGESISGTTSMHLTQQAIKLKKGERYIVSFTIKNIFLTGTYSVSCGLEKIIIPGLKHHLIDGAMHAATFSIQPPDDALHGIIAKVKMDADLKIERVSS